MIRLPWQGSEAAIAEFIPYSHHLSDTIMSLKDGQQYVSTIRIAGRAHENQSAETLADWTKDLNHALCMIANEHVTFWSHVDRRRVRAYPDGDYDGYFCRRLNDKYRARFDGYNLMVNDLYLSVVFTPNADDTLSHFSKIEPANARERKQRQEAALKALDETTAALVKALASYGPRLLSTYTHNGYAFSELAEFFGYLLNGESNRAPVLRTRFSSHLPKSRILFDEHGELGEIRGIRESKLFGLLEITDYDDFTEPGHLNQLLHLPFEMLLTQTFSTRSRNASLEFLRRHMRQMEDAKDAAISQMQALGHARDRLASGQIKMGEHHAVLRISGASAMEVRDRLATARASLGEVAIASSLVDGKATEAAYWSQLPGNGQFRPRPCPISTENFLCFSPFHNFMTGKANYNPWGPAVTLLKTASGTPYFFNFHWTPPEQDSTGKRPPGNTAVIGKTGTGKTVWLGFLIAQAQKFPATVVAFDKDNGMELQVRAMGGRYFPLEVGRPTGWNPLQMEPTPRNLVVMRRLIIRALGSDKMPVTHGDSKQITQALRTVVQEFDRPERRLSRLLESLPNPSEDDPDSRPSVHARLRKWCAGGEYGWLFDNPHDLLDLSTHRIYGFDGTELLEEHDILDLSMDYLTHRTEAMIDGKPFIYVFDEAWKWWDVPIMAKLGKNKIKTIRKEGGILVYATQEPGDALSSEISATLSQGISTYAFLPNPEANRDEYVNGFKVTDAEFETIISLGEQSRRCLLKQGGVSTVVELDLGGFDDELAILSGTPDSALIAREVIAEVGEDPEKWVPAFTARMHTGRQLRAA